MRERIAEQAPAAPARPERERTAPAGATGASTILDLQRTIGNQATVGLLQRRGDSDVPPSIRGAMEQLSGTSLAGVRVHENSAAPARIGAAAFTAGDDIHLGPGHAADLGHEAWHVVQQRQGRVPSTGTLGSADVNLDPGLEMEADQMASRAAAQPALSDPPPLDPPPTSMPSPVVQGRWLIYSNGASSTYFWEDEPGVEPTPPPEMWSRFAQLPEAPAKGTYSVDRGPRGTPLVYSVEQYRLLFASARRDAAPSDVYNPFGRMNATTTISTYLPADPRTGPRVLKALAGKDKTYRRIRDVHARRENGFPIAVLVDGYDEWLPQTGTSLLGASYGNGIASDGQAVADAMSAENASDLELVEASEAIKVASRTDVNASVVKFWAGRERDVSQATVMGESAGDVAANAGYAKDEGKGWEWLHLIAHSMGGIDVVGPQVPGNLVVGTSECNSQMIVVEEFLKDILLRFPTVRARLLVMAEMIDQQRHIASRISYDFLIYPPGGDAAVAVFHWTFDPLSRRQPTVTENRQTRYAGRAMFGEDKSFEAPPKPKTLPPERPVSFLDSVDAARMADLLKDVTAAGLEAASADELMGRADAAAVSVDGMAPDAIDAALADYGMRRGRADSFEYICLIDSIHQVLWQQGIPVDRQDLVDAVRRTTGTDAWQMLDLVGVQGQQVLQAVHEVVLRATGRNENIVAHVMLAMPDGSVIPLYRANEFRVAGTSLEIDLDVLFVNNNHFEPLFELD